MITFLLIDRVTGKEMAVRKHPVDWPMELLIAAADAVGFDMEIINVKR